MEQMVHDAVNEPVLPLIPSTVRRVLDIGCGSGVLGERIKQEHPGCHVVGITLSPAEAQACAGRLDTVYIRDLQTENFRDLGQFDCIVCSHTLGYFADTQRLLGEIKATLTSEGVLVVALPNILHWPQRLKFLRGQFRYTEGGLLDRYYVRFFDNQTAQDVIHAAGLDILSFDADGYLPLPGLRRLIGARAAQRWDKTAVRRFPGFLGTQFLIAARPKP